MAKVSKNAKTNRQAQEGSKDYVKVIKDASSMMGKDYFFRNKNEYQNLKFRRSIYTISDIKKGEKFSKKNIKIIRPGFGIQPIYYEKLLKKKSPVNLTSQQPLKKKMLKKIWGIIN